MRLSEFPLDSANASVRVVYLPCPSAPLQSMTVAASRTNPLTRSRTANLHKADPRPFTAVRCTDARNPKAPTRSRPARKRLDPIATEPAHLACAGFTAETASPPTTRSASG
jgi:hypothetical protein